MKRVSATFGRINWISGEPYGFAVRWGQRAADYPMKGAVYPYSASRPCSWSFAIGWDAHGAVDHALSLKRLCLRFRAGRRA